MNENQIQMIKNSLTIILLLFIIFISMKLMIIYLPFLIGYILSYILEPIIKFINKKTHISRKACTIISLFTIIILFLGVFILGAYKLFSETNNLLNGLNNYIDIINNFINEFVKNINSQTSDFFNIFSGTIKETIDSLTRFLKDFLTKIILYITSVPKMLINIVITILATYFISSDKFYILDTLEHQFSKKMIGKLLKYIRQISKSILGYVKAEIILSIITFIIILIFINIFYMLGMNINYPILIALLIGFIDLLPIFGAGFILIPWSLYLFITKEITYGFWILGLYILVTSVKQLLEPKLISSGLGIHPLFTLISMYSGFILWGIEGLIFGPIILIVLKHMFQDLLDKGLINFLND